MVTVLDSQHRVEIDQQCVDTLRSELATALGLLILNGARQFVAWLVWTCRDKGHPPYKRIAVLTKPYG
jgi:hypothetical protein